MTMLDYFDKVGESIEFLIAVGSIVGILGLIIGIIFFIIGGQYRLQMLELIIISIILLAFCGLHTGTKYFNLY